MLQDFLDPEKARDLIWTAGGHHESSDGSSSASGNGGDGSRTSRSQGILGGAVQEEQEDGNDQQGGVANFDYVVDCIGGLGHGGAVGRLRGVESSRR